MHKREKKIAKEICAMLASFSSLSNCKYFSDHREGSLILWQQRTIVEKTAARNENEENYVLKQILVISRKIPPSSTGKYAYTLLDLYFPAFVRPSIHLSVRPSVHPSIQFVHLSIQFVYPSIYFICPYQNDLPLNDFYSASLWKKKFLFR